jgi:hypothetical protein
MVVRFTTTCAILWRVIPPSYSNRTVPFVVQLPFTLSFFLPSFSQNIQSGLNIKTGLAVKRSTGTIHLAEISTAKTLGNGEVKVKIPKSDKVTIRKRTERLSI